MTTQIVEVGNGQIEKYPGSYDEYLWSLEKGILSQRLNIQSDANSVVVEKIQLNNEKKFNYKEETKKLQSEIKDCERKILKTEELLFQQSKKIDEINSLLMSTQGQQAQQLAKDAAKINQETENLENALLMYMENLEQKKIELTKITNK